MWVFDNQLRADDGRVLATFSSHWAACAAMLRQSNPTFKSLGGDNPEDLAIEAALTLTPEESEADSVGSYNHAIQAIGDRVKAGEPPPTTGYFGPSQLFREGR